MNNIKQVTVFGGSGFLGQAIVRALAPQGYLVRVACRRIELAEKVKTAGDVGQITLMRTNLRIPESVSIAIEGSQAVINAAGIPFERGRQRYQAVHVGGRPRDRRGRPRQRRRAAGPCLRHRRRQPQLEEPLCPVQGRGGRSHRCRLRECHDPAAERGVRSRRRAVQPPGQGRRPGALHAGGRQRPGQGPAGLRGRRRQGRRGRAGAARHGAQGVRAGRAARLQLSRDRRAHPARDRSRASRSSACRPA